MTVFEPEKIIVDILTHEMNLPASYGTYQGNIIPSIVIGSQNALLGNTDNLQIIVQSIFDKPIHNTTYYTSVTAGCDEVNEQIIFSTMQIDIQSRNNTARQRRSEVLFALSSVYAQQVQESNGCRIFHVPITFLNTSDVQGGSALNRWTLRFKMTYKQTYNKSIDYYDKFQADWETEKEDGNIYFYDEN